MLKRIRLITLIATLSLCAPIITHAQDSGALLDLLIRKKIITDQEAEEVRAELTKQTSETSAGKLKLSTPVTELEIYADTRVRYEYRGGETASTSDHPNDSIERQRERYRLRIGLRATLSDDWFAGIRLETSANDRSGNVTFGDDTSTTTFGSSGNTTTVNGPFAKNSDTINVGQAYIGYRGIKDLTLTVGRMPNPLVSTWMVWDPDINPEGVAEQFKHTFDLNFGGGAVATAPTYSKDGKTVASSEPASEGWKLKIDLFANFAQFVYDDVNPENPLGPRKTSGSGLVPRTDAWMVAWQVGAKFTFPKNIYAQIAPTLYNYTGNGDTFNGHFQGGDPALSNSDSLAQNQTGINSLLVFDMPTEIGWKLGELPMRLFGDFAVNLEASGRADAAGHPTKDDQRYAYMVGIGIGQLKQKHDWQVDVFWQHDGQYSLDPNLIDDDIFDAHLNLEGVGLRAGYMVSDAVSFNVTYNYGWRADSSLGTGGVGAIGINPLEKYQLFMADLNLKF